MSGFQKSIGIARIDYDALARLLQLPVGQRITGVHCPFNQDVIELRLEGAGLPVVPLGHVIPQVPLTLKT